jgi:hypothetical protein
VSFSVDHTPPTTPTSVTHLTDSTSTVCLSWGASTDALSGLGGYQILVDGVLTAQTVSTTYTVTGLNSGQTYGFVVQAVDLAGNVAPASPVTETVASTGEYLQLSITTPSPTQTVSFGTIDPVTTATVSAGTTVTVSGFTNLSYTLAVQGGDFTGSSTASMPASLLSYRMFGTATLPWTPVSNGQQTLATGTGVLGRWQQSYGLDYQLNVPYNHAPDTYSTSLLYSVVQN